MRNATRKRKGFTLVELLTTMMLIGLLAAMIMPNFWRARFRAYLSACVQNEKNISTALESYAHDFNGRYPTDLNTLTTTATGSQYMSVIPTCPSNKASYTGSYFVNNSVGAYTVACPGIHGTQLNDRPDGFPQYTNGQLIER